MSAIEIVLRILIWIVSCTIGYFLFNGLVVSIIDEYNARKAVRLKVVLDDGAYAPERAHDTDAGMDLRTPHRVVIPAGGSMAINTGVHMEIPPGYFGKLESKSGLNVKHDVVSHGGTIDSGYTGAIVAKLYNHGKTDYEFNRGDKIIQIIIQPCQLCGIEVVEELDETERGTGGFGSTGR